MKWRMLRQGTLASVVMTSLATLLPQAAQAIDAPPTQWAVTQLSGMTAPNTLLSHPDGGVTIGCDQGSASTVLNQSFNSSGGVTWKVPITSGPLVYTCPGTSAIGRDGTIYSAYMPDQIAGRFTKVLAHKTSTQMWAYNLPCSAQSLLHMTLGADGNLYFVISGGSCGASRVIGIKTVPAAGSTSPAQVMSKTLEGSVVPAMGAYATGLVIRYNDGWQYLDYSGYIRPKVLLNPYTEQQGEQAAATFDGRSFVAIKGTAGSDWGCYGEVALSVRAYEPKGSAWTSPYELPRCSKVLGINPMPDGGVAMNLDVPKSGTSRFIRHSLVIVLDSLKAERWRMEFAPEGTVDGSDYSYGAPQMSVDLKGNIVIQRYFSEGKFVDGRYKLHSGTKFDVYSGMNRSRIGGFTIGGVPQSGATDWYSHARMKIALGTQTAFVVANKCTTNQCEGSPWLLPVKVEGLEADYPRARVLSWSPLSPIPVVGPCKSDHFVGVRGSGEKQQDFGGFGSTVAAVKDELNKRITGMAAQSIDYPAIPVLFNLQNYIPEYYESVSTGKYILGIYLTRLMRDCPQARVFLVGYSQGAQVAADTLEELPNLHKRTTALVLVGDPRFNPEQRTVNSGNYDSTLRGIYQVVDNRMRVIPEELVLKAQNYCLLGDPICNLSFTNVTSCLKKPDECPHGHYVSRQITLQAAIWAFSKR